LSVLLVLLWSPSVPGGSSRSAEIRLACFFFHSSCCLSFPSVFTFLSPFLSQTAELLQRELEAERSRYAKEVRQREELIKRITEERECQAKQRERIKKRDLQPLNIVVPKIARLPVFSSAR
jgi:hypothetical protein